MRMLSGVDFPSFMAAADHAAGVEGEFEIGETAGRVEDLAAKTLDVLLGRMMTLLALNWTLTTASIGPALGV